MSVYHDPEGLALLFVQQYLSEQGHSTALAALEQATGVKYDDDKPKRGSELLELVYQFVEQQLAASFASADADATRAGHHNGTSSQLSRQVQQQHAKLREEFMLRSAAADYPSHVQHSLSHFPANLLSVLMWPGEDLVLTGAADGTVRLTRFGAQAAAAAAGEVPQEGSSAVNSSTASGSSSEVWVTKLGGAGGVLTLAWHPAVQAGRHRFAAGSEADPNTDCLLLAGCMDGSVHVLHAAAGRIMASAKPHSKYVVGASWAPALLVSRQQQQKEAPGQQLIATSSWDSSCCLLQLVRNQSSQDGQQQQQQLSLHVVQQVPFSGYVQDVCFLPVGAAGPTPSSDHSSSSSNSTGNEVASDAAADGDGAQRLSSGSLQLVVAVRGTNCLHVLDVSLLRYSNAAATSSSDGSTAAAAAAAAASLPGSNEGVSSSSSSAVWSVTAAGLVNMSEAGDSHVSFSAMKLAVSPCNRYLLIATDSPILLVLRLSDWGVVRRLYGLDVDKFHNALVAWHKDSSYVLAGAAQAAVYVYHIGTAKIVAKLRGHTVNVRSISYDARSNRLATCSFDKSVKVYGEL